MRKFITVFLNSMRRAKAFLIMAIGLGAFICIILGMLMEMTGGFHSNVSVGVLDEDNTSLSEHFKAYLQDKLSMDLSLSEDINVLNGELVERDISAIIKLPDGYEDDLMNGRKPIVKVNYLNDYENTVFINGYLESYMNYLQTALTDVNGDKVLGEKRISSADENMPEIKYKEFDEHSQQIINENNAFMQAMGFFMMFNFLLSIGLASMISDDRKNGMLRRIRCSDIHTLQYVFGICLVGMVTAGIMVAILFAYTAITGLNIGMPMTTAIVLCIAYALFIIAFSLVMGLYLPSKNSILAAIVGTSTITCLLGGAYFPLDTAPEFMQNAARFTPQFWFMDVVRNLQGGLEINWEFNLLIILMFAFLCFILPGIRFASSKADESML